VVDVADRGGLGQLEDQARSIDARVRQGSIDDRDELRADRLSADHVEVGAPTFLFV